MKRWKGLWLLIGLLMLSFVGAVSVSAASRSTASGGKAVTLKSGKWVTMPNKDGYYKIQVKKEGHIMLESNCSMDVCLYNSSKKAIAEGKLVKLRDGDEYKGKDGKCGFYVKKGTYYISASIAYDYEWSVYKFRYTYYKLGQAPFVIKHNTPVDIYCGSRNVSGEPVYQYFQYKAKVNGYIKVSTLDEVSVRMALCDSRKKPLMDNGVKGGYESSISDDDDVEYEGIYGVKKGKLYYIRIENIYDSTFRITLKETSVKEKSGATMKKAVNIKSGRMIEGTLETGSKSADWYKFTLSKEKKVKIIFYGLGWDMKCRVYNSKKKLIAEIQRQSYPFDNVIVSRGLKNPLKKGTYYISIMGDSGGEPVMYYPGYYSLKWK